MITAQNGTEFVHSEYHKIKKVVNIWVCMAPPNEQKRSITRYHLAEENLIGNVKEPIRNYDLINVRRTVPITPNCSRNSDELFSKKKILMLKRRCSYIGTAPFFTYSNYGIQHQRGRGEICVLPLKTETTQKESGSGAII